VESARRKSAHDAEIDALRVFGAQFGF
jgi:hypothetical protein